MTTASRTLGSRASAASTSPGSIRCPRIFTCRSTRPANSMVPSLDTGRGPRSGRGVRRALDRTDSQRTARPSAQDGRDSLRPAPVRRCGFRRVRRAPPAHPGSRAGTPPCSRSAVRSGGSLPGDRRRVFRATWQRSSSPSGRRHAATATAGPAAARRRPIAAPRFAAEQHLATRQRRRVRRAPSVEQRRREEQRGHALAVQRLGETARRKHSVARDDSDARAVEEGPQISKVAASNAGFDRCATVSSAPS